MLSLIYFGTPQFSVTILDALLQAGYPILGVVTTPDQPQGRKNLPKPTPVKTYALEHDLPIFTPTRLRNDPELLKQLSDLKPDVILVFSYGKIIPDEILAIPRLGAINIHPSLLPKYRGPTPVQTQLLEGETTAGVSVIFMNSQVDAGPILDQRTIEVDAQATFASLIDESAKLGATMMLDLLPKLNAGTVQAVEQDHSQATFCKHISKEDGFLPPSNLATEEPSNLDRKIRAYYPWPGVWTKLDDGRVLKLLPEHKVQLEGKQPIDVKQFLNGYPAYKDLLKGIA